MPKYLKLIIAIIIPQLAGFLGSIANFASIDTWYKGLVKPSFNPPNWIFGPVWTTLFLLMGVSLYFVWTTEGQNKKLAYWIFGIQLILNILWSFVFFFWQNQGWALAEIAVLWVSILANIIIFYRINRTAGLLLLPYILWISFAAVLNYSLWRLN